MLQVYECPFYDKAAGRQRLALAEELAYASRRLETRFGWSVGDARPSSAIGHRLA